jgi:D-lactate dehydrogenase (cytochrome)
MRENVLALTVVNAHGEVMTLGTRAKKSSAGYDLTRLFVGSEGTLGVITEITLKLYPQPESIMVAICNFNSIADAVNTTIAVIQMGVPIARCEFLDTHAVRAVNKHDMLGLKEGPMLLMEFHGSPASVKEQVQTVQEIARDNSGEDFQWASTPEERSKLWAARHNAYFAGLQMKPGCRSVTTDTCVPISRLAECLLDTMKDVDESGLQYFVVGHVGDGNFHVAYLIDPHKPEERDLAERLNAQLVDRALKLGGTCTGEHGIGLHKQEFLVQETGAEAVAMMRAVKQALDPHNIMNPGKIFSSTA